MHGRAVRGACLRLNVPARDSVESTNVSPALRVGCVKYLNARPLICDWPGSVTLNHPATLCAQLANGDLDVALVSSFEFFRNPIYRVVDGVSISSHGPVYSVVVAHSGDISEIEEIELDSASNTSVNLLRCLLAEARIAPHLMPPSTLPIAAGRGRLLIGDQAIRFRLNDTSGLRFWDLGEQWKKLVDIPFTYALWLIRPEVKNPEEIATRLRALRDENLSHLNRIVATEKEFDSGFCTRYYQEHLRFSLGEAEKTGLRAFAKLCAKHDLLPKVDLAFDLV